MAVDDPVGGGGGGPSVGVNFNIDLGQLAKSIQSWAKSSTTQQEMVENAANTAWYAGHQHYNVIAPTRPISRRS
ncbi:hypothetical protein [Actinoallomurus sp. NPDC050550]|uniref:hypothetical protein n=1 Tax=Actinoallomurus sp. NPDC050550 TaxID=3154937 RepID=UPI0033E86918